MMKEVNRLNLSGLQKNHEEDVQGTSSRYRRIRFLPKDPGCLDFCHPEAIIHFPSEDSLHTSISHVQAYD